MHLLEGRVIRDGTKELDEYTARQWSEMGYSGGEFSPFTPTLAANGLYAVVKNYLNDLEATCREIDRKQARIAYLDDEPRWTIGEAAQLDGIPIPTGDALKRYAVEVAKRFCEMKLARIKYVMDRCPGVFVGVHWDHRGGRGISRFEIRHDWEQYVATARQMLTSDQLPFLFLHTANWGHFGQGTSKVLVPYVAARFNSLGQEWGMYMVNSQADADYGSALIAAHRHGAKWATTYSLGPRELGTGDEGGFETWPLVKAGVDQWRGYQMEPPIFGLTLPDPRIVVVIGGLEKQAEDVDVSDTGWMTERSAPWKLEQDGTILALCHAGLTPTCLPDGFAGIPSGKYWYSRHLAIPAAPHSVSARAAHLYMDLSENPGARYLSALTWASEELPHLGWRELIQLDEVRLERSWARYHERPQGGIPPASIVDVAEAREAVAAPARAAIEEPVPPPPPPVDELTRLRGFANEVKAAGERWRI